MIFIGKRYQAEAYTRGGRRLEIATAAGWHIPDHKAREQQDAKQAAHYRTANRRGIHKRQTGQGKASQHHYSAVYIAYTRLSVKGQHQLHKVKGQHQPGGTAAGHTVQGLLEQIFFNKCHTIITNIKYQERLRQLTSLHQFRYPLVILTATLPILIEAIIQAPTIRVNIQYQVELVKPGRKAIEDRVIATIKAIKTQISAAQQGIIYCQSIKQYKEIATQVSYKAHHSKLIKDTQASILQDWVDRRGATTGLKTEVNIKSIIKVIHIGPPFRLVDFIQQTRQERQQKGEGDKFGSDINHINQKGVGLFIEGKGYQQLILGQFFNRAKAKVSSYKEIQAEYYNRYLKKGINRVGNREDIRKDNAKDKKEGREEDKEEDKEEDNNKSEKVPAATTVNRLKENIQKESRQITKLYSWLDQVQGVGYSVCFIKWHIHKAKEEDRGRIEHQQKDYRLLQQKDFNR
ncbi:unnamed protein product [Fusarium fujikuroi]|nr:unnamed protein product [Fusarium fujikuroi]